MKRLVLVFVLICTLILGMGTVPVMADSAATQQEIIVLLDGGRINFDVPPAIQNGRTLVPFRAIAETLNIQVTWDAVTRSVKARSADIEVNMQIDNQYASINNREVKMDTAPVIINGRTLIPARFFSETFGCKVEWVADTRTVKIYSGPTTMKVVAFYALGDKKTSSWNDLFQTPYPQTGRGNTGVVTDLALGWYSLDEAGNLLTRSTTGWQRPEGWENVVEAAQKYEMKTDMVIHMTDGDARIRRLLNNPVAVEQAITSIVKEARMYNGVNLDFEGLGYKDSGQELNEVQSAFNSFVAQLSQQLHNNKCELTLSLHPLNSAYPGYDYKTLGKLADYIIIMAYDYGVKPEPAGMVKQAIEMARELVPAEKLILGISAASETSESIADKISLANRYDLQGIALWRLGLLHDGMWDTLHNNIKPAKE
ncbi:MAG: stalk domain-containing protein [Syntrophomonadaceae bacterium]|nr:stalk domain-containing protein [Syntrophomonadaceae bacterium]MDD3888949.1 stalk domain-containing protein [Syntrophomonadaceae bacterium]MDD4548693.1 stalk domain-containing protein [Syntrophomonadaceae bacterium]